MIQTVPPSEKETSSDVSPGIDAQNEHTRQGGGAETPAPAESGSAGSGSADSESTGSGNDGTEKDTGSLPLDQVFEILKNSRRRRVIAYLNDNDGEATLSDLAEHIAAIENDVSIRSITSSQRKRVYVGLYQCHLPKMDDMDIVDFDKNRGTVELAANASQLDEYVGESNTVNWALPYIGVTVAGIVLFATSTLAAAPSVITPTTVGFTVLGAMALCAGIHAYVETHR